MEVRRSHLRVISAALSNIGAGLLLSPFTIKGQTVLTASLIIAIVSFSIAIDAEEALDNYD